MGWSGKKRKWEVLFAKEEPPFLPRLLVSLLISAIGFSITLLLYRQTHFYFTSVTIVSSILVSLYSGLSFGLIIAVILALTDDYLFIPPIGSVLDSVIGYEHLVIVVIFAWFVAFLGSSLRSAYRAMMLAKQAADQAKQDAERASDLMEKILALVSHDIRNPLAAIKMGSQLILRTPGQSERHQPILSRILSSVEQVDSLINSLLDVARIRSGEMIQLEFEFCDLSVRVAQMVEDMSLLESERLRFHAGDPLWGAWGINGIRRLLQNLVSNAIKYGDPKAAIEIKLIRRNDRAALTVHNLGRSIPLEFQSRLFDAFQRIPDSNTNAPRGWGLGLALVKGIADAHDGTVQVDSSVSEGTTFTVELPIRTLEQARAVRSCRNAV